MSIFSIAIFLIFTSQFYWLWRGVKFARRRIPQAGRRWTVIGLVLAVYLGLWYFNVGASGGRRRFISPGPMRCWWRRS
jgi:hypothetical protein